MKTIELDSATEFAAALISSERSPAIPESADVYGWLIGSWELDVIDYDTGGNTQRSRGEVHFGWVLEGRAVQDVWIMPRRDDRSAKMDLRGNRYGTTLRVWDSSIEAWRITWVNPVTGTRDELVGRWVGKDIVQIGTDGQGVPIRWSFTEITRDSFRWIGETLQPDGKTWRLESEFYGKRTG